MATSTQAPVRRTNETRRPRPGRPLAPPRRSRRAVRIVLIAALLCAVPVIASYAGVVTQTSNSSLGVRTVEWLSDNGARGLVSKVESWYYAAIAPSTGGPALRALPRQPGVAAGSGAGGRLPVRAYRPPPIKPLIKPALAGEGVWRSTFAGAGRHPPVLVTSFRSDPAYPQMVVGAAWIDHTRTSTWLYPGRQEPAVSMASRGPLEVPTRLRPTLVATFNSAFKLSDSGGGVAIGGHTYAPMKNGLATILRYRNGRVDVTAWNGGADVGPNVIYARQNLPLIVDGGHPNPNLSGGPEWGATLGNAIRVWRSAIGVDRFGNLIYIAANDQTVGSLAAAMIHVGAVRAMELDINSYWPSFITYRHPGALGAANLLPDMARSNQRYLTPDDRDFFAVYAR